jgi:hypothetical protein
MKKVLIGCGIVAALLVAALVAGLVWLVTGGEVEDINVVVEGPVAVIAGEEFTLTARIRNSAGRPQKLVDLDIADSYLDGIVISGSEPAFRSSEHIPIDRSVSHSYDQAIPARGELVVTLHALALRPGDFAGDFDFCINRSYAYLTHHIRTVVRPAAGVGRAAGAGAGRRSHAAGRRGRTMSAGGSSGLRRSLLEPAAQGR